MNTTHARWAASLLTASAMALGGWTPNWNQEGWLAALTSHACSDVTITAGSPVTVECGAGDRVVAVRSPLDHRLAHQAGATLRWTVEGDGSLRAPRARVFTTGEWVIIERETCSRCARIMGNTVMFRPDAVSAATLASVQSWVGRPSVAPMRTVQAWTR